MLRKVSISSVLYTGKYWELINSPLETARDCVRDGDIIYTSLPTNFSEKIWLQLGCFTDTFEKRAKPGARSVGSHRFGLGLSDQNEIKTNRIIQKKQSSTPCNLASHSRSSERMPFLTFEPIEEEMRHTTRFLAHEIEAHEIRVLAKANIV